MSHPENYLERILTSRVYDVAVESPLDVASNLSRRLNNQILLKREDLQPVFSFKCRGAYNKMSGLSAAQLARGVVAASAGNHAQGVALAAQTLNARATIVMPATTPKIKVDAVAARGATVILHGDSYDDAYAYAIELTKSEHATFVQP
jgi:threonine dehydratase